MRSSLLLCAFVGVSGALSGVLGVQWAGARRELFLPGPTTDGHYQIEHRCELCHAPGGGVRQEACVGCHGAELAQADDKHPLTKFLDPRNADYLRLLDARRCVTCHVEHRPALTGAMGVTRPVDLCVACHADVATDHPDHAALPFTSCQDAGCHNYHDDRALTADFLRRHLDEPDVVAAPLVPAWTRRAAADVSPLSRGQADAPAVVRDGDGGAAAVDEWAASGHARAGVNCSACHLGEDAATGASRWVERPDQRFCRGCHDGEVDGFLRGRHGMRQAVDLPALTPGQARQPMTAAAHDRTLDCASCHGAHTVNTRRAAAVACLACHRDEHSLAWESTPHAALWRAEQNGTGAPGSGVSCATCHLPRVPSANRGGITVEHAQNDTLRPREKQLRPVCQGCHGVGFALSALADEALMRANFPTRPARSAPALDMLRVQQKE